MVTVPTPEWMTQCLLPAKQTMSCRRAMPSVRKRRALQRGGGGCGSRGLIQRQSGIDPGSSVSNTKRTRRRYDPLLCRRLSQYVQKSNSEAGNERLRQRTECQCPAFKGLQTQSWRRNIRFCISRVDGLIPAVALETVVTSARYFRARPLPAVSHNRANHAL